VYGHTNGLTSLMRVATPFFLPVITLAPSEPNPITLESGTPLSFKKSSTYYTKHQKDKTKTVYYHKIKHLKKNCTRPPQKARAKYNKIVQRQ
jgi:hypothetical protein